MWIESVNGYGLVTERNILKGDFVCNYRGIHSQKGDSKNPMVFGYEHDGQDYFIDASDLESGLARFVNDVDAIIKHPNLKSVVTECGDSSTVSYIAVQDISIGKQFFVI